MSNRTTPIIYNLFPRLLRSVDQWPEHAKRAADMGFNWLYVNPVHPPGFSGSLYAIKDYERINPQFLPDASNDRNDRIDRLTPMLERIKACGLRPMVDLVINHTAKDSPLVTDHPGWYVRDEEGKVQSPYAVDPDDPTKKTVWGDLAEIDNLESPDRNGLWDYWAQVLERYLRIGFEGFRCDAAYKVPAELWQFLIERSRRVNPEALFFAETLGCTLEQTQALRGSGFHFFFNSSKWWDFEASWCLDQHREFEDIPSISFPESHDTERLARESGGNEAVQRQRYAFAATFSAGLMMPIGYEFGFRKKPHVVETRPEDWEPPLFDLTGFIGAVNRLKTDVPLLQGEGSLRALTGGDINLLVIERRSARAPRETGWILINKRTSEPAVLPTDVLPDKPDRRMLKLSHCETSQWTSFPGKLTLNPAEVVLVHSLD